MANFVAGILGSAADGESFTGQAHRLGMASHATIVGDSSSALRSRSGIIPGGGTPLDVTALGTPAMKVNVKSGTCAVQDTGTTGGVHTVTLTTATDLDIATANATNPRIDLVVVKVFADGTSATNCTVEVLTGTPAGSPVRPSIASPPTNTHYFPLAQVRVEAAATSIVASKVTKTIVDGVQTVAPGGVVPVASVAAASGLPMWTPFFSAADLRPGTILSGGATLNAPVISARRYDVTTGSDGRVWVTVPDLSTVSGAIVQVMAMGPAWGARVYQLSAPNLVLVEVFRLDDATIVPNSAFILGLIAWS
jgi:hypothetical protein